MMELTPEQKMFKAKLREAQRKEIEAIRVCKELYDSCKHEVTTIFGKRIYCAICAQDVTDCIEKEQAE